ncbi:DUF3168 domain-containing protein [Massilia forsythiae]|uniref:DUF3168 domain-containing protein n=1 Tax=Massilia forsythiae TaxID=2728020 RepID=A0A7Z2W0T8_9BURK|nr:DUF3168 domain-containing protein [Massilia forsythiae]QJE03046.1 DUF3168 domain-containing protein [Massilia forsythiae]
MSAHAAVLALLQAAPGLTALVGDRIYPEVLDDPPVFPAVTFQQMGGAGARGAVKNPGLMRASFQVSTWAESRAEAVLIVAQVRKALDRKRKITVAGVPIDDCFYESDIDLDDPDAGQPGVGVWFNHMSFTIHYREP